MKPDILTSKGKTDIQSYNWNAYMAHVTHLYADCPAAKFDTGSMEGHVRSCLQPPSNTQLHNTCNSLELPQFMASGIQGPQKFCEPTAMRMYLEIVSVPSTKRIRYIYPNSTSNRSLHQRRIPQSRNFFVPLITAELTLIKNKQETETNA